MIFFFENGRIGNQLFQYCGLKTYFPKHKIFFFGLNSLKNSFDNIEGIFFDLSNKKKFYFIRILKQTLFFLAKIRIIGKIIESDKEKKIKIIYGILYNIFVAKEIYFQDKKSVLKIKNLPVFKKIFLFEAQKWLEKKKIFNKRSQLVFVHIRRGDYLSWPDVNYPAVLNLYWYKKAMLTIKKKIKKPIFILMGDDVYYLQDTFKETRSLIISKNPYMVDLSIMSICSHGILSPSSFAWWGAFLSKKKNTNKLKTYFIAKKFWAGHRLQKWYPSKYTSDWLTYL